MKRLTILFILFGITTSMAAQGQLFGLKGGLSVGLQRWNSFERDPLLASHFAISMESAEESRNSALYGQIGYHTKGSALRSQRFFDINGNEYRPTTTNFKFNNAALQIGVKQILGEDSANSRLFWKVGLRGEYTLSTNLDQFNNQLSLSFPTDDWVNKVTYGVSFGGGYEFYLSDLIRGFIELHIGQDLSNQYQQPAISGISDPNRPGQTINISERKITNTVVELSVGLLLWRKVEYID